MRQILTSELTDILKNRMTISRETKVFKLCQVAKGWEISWGTMYRYESPKYREQSRVVAKNYRKIDYSADIERVRELKRQGLNSLIVANLLNLPLRRVNRIFPMALI